jgi:hypothetical protein
MYRTHEQMFADRIQVKLNPQVKLTLTADDWQLYDGEGYERRDVAARVMNQQIADAIHCAGSRSRAYMECQRVLQRWDEFGAADSEGWQMLDYIFRTVYGEGE